jgi:hypothetical protein
MKPEIPIDQPPKLDISQSDKRGRPRGRGPLLFQFNLWVLLIPMLLLSIALTWTAISLFKARREQEWREWRKQRVAAITAPWREFGPVDVWLDKEGKPRVPLIQRPTRTTHRAQRLITQQMSPVRSSWRLNWRRLAALSPRRSRGGFAQEKFSRSGQAGDREQASPRE